MLTDELPAGLTFVSSTGDGDYDPVDGPLDAGLDRVGRDGIPHDRRDRDSVPESFVNTVSLTSLTQTDTDPTNNSASVQVTGIVLADLSITKS